jgi:hypothetical protein
MERLTLKKMRRLLAALALVSSVHAQTATPSGLHYIGRERQFFFDDGIVETMDHTRLRLNPAEKVVPNPVLPRDKPWEGSDLRIAWIFFDHRLDKFRMRYSSGAYVANGRNAKGEVIINGASGSQVDEASKSRICEAFSDDGIHWQKPNLGLVEFEGSKANNIIPPQMHYAYFFEDMHDPDPGRRYKAQLRTGHIYTDGMTFSYYFSRDGYHWTAYAHNPIIDTGTHPGRWGPTDFMGWDSIRKTYAVHMENNYHMHSPYWRRSIGRAESPDMVHWSDPETIIVADAQDYPDIEFYDLPVICHDGWYIGFLWNFSTTNTTQAPQFIYSRDGVQYHREFREPIINRGDPGSFDSACVYASAPIIRNDRIYCYYTGTNWRSPDQLLQLGNKATAGIGLALLPLDGFVSLEGARHDYSIVTTRSFTFAGRGLYLNLQAALQEWGAEPCDVRVEMLDGRLTPIPGFTFADADRLATTAVNQQVSWRGKSDVSALAGRPARLKIYFKNAKLYAFQFR